MDATTAVAAASPIIFKVGGAWYFDPISRAKAAEYGLKGYPFYFAGRSGVIGDIGPASVVAAIPFFEPGLVTKQFGNAIAERTPSELGRAAAEALAEWGRAKFAGIDGAGRTAELGRRIVDTAEGFGRPLFTAWRAVPVPDDAPAGLALTIQSLRELRGDSHILACAVLGLSPLEAIVGRDGTEHAGQFGWPEPYPDPAAISATRTEAEDLTDRQMTRFYGVLSGSELDDLVEGLRPTEAATAG